MKEAKIILYSSSGHVSEELFLLQEILKSSPVLLHLKKDKLNVDDYRALVENFPNRIFFHSEDPKTPKEQRHGISSGHSASFHSWEEVEDKSSLVDYFFLSPFFNSISKHNYAANPELSIQNLIEEHQDKLVALGGINETKFKELKELGVKNIALLGAVWNSSSPIDTCQMLCRKWLEQE